MIPLTDEQIEEFLKAEGLAPQFQEETKQVAVTIKIDDVEFPTFFRISEGPLLQVVTFLPIQYSEETVADTARLLHLINKEVDMPGFGMDEMTDMLFYRSVLPSHDKKIDPALIRSSLKALEVISQAFLNAVNAVAQGAITFEDAVKRAMEAGQK